jgi:hypothetical protein
MTQERLVKYLVDHVIYSHKALSSLKDLVNEAIQECADSVDKYGPYLNQNGGTKVITNLKVK